MEVEVKESNQGASFPLHSRYVLRIGKKTCMPLSLLVNPDIQSEFTNIHFQKILAILHEKLPEDFLHLQTDEDEIVFTVKNIQTSSPKKMTLDSRMQFSYNFHRTIPHFAVVQKTQQQYQGIHVCKYTLIVEVWAGKSSSSQALLSDIFLHSSVQKKPIPPVPSKQNQKTSPSSEQTSKSAKPFQYLNH